MSPHTHISARRLSGYAGALLALSAALFLAGSVRAWAQSSAQPSASADNPKIVVGASSSGVSQLSLFVATQEGMFKKAGLDVTLQLLSGGTPSAMASFASGAVNMMNLSAPEVIQYTSKKVISGKIFGEMGDMPIDLVSAKGITKVQDIAGKIIGISSPNGADHIFILGIMQHYGISANDVTFVNSGNPLNRLAALSAGSVQVVAGTNYQREQSMQVGNVLLKAEDSPVKYPTQLLVANDDLLKNHKPLLKTFLATLSQATAWIRANQPAAAADCAKSLGATVEFCASAIAFELNPSLNSPYTWSSTLAVNVDGVKSALVVMAAIDPATKNVTVDDIVDTSIAGTTP